MGKELTYHRTLRSRAPGAARAAKVMGEVRTKHSERAERLNILSLDPQVTTTTSHGHMTYHCPCQPPRPPINPQKEKLNQRYSRRGAPRLSRDQEGAQG